MATKFTRFLLSSLMLATLLSSCIKDQEEITTRFYDPADYAVLERVLNIPNDQIDYQATLAPHMKFTGMQAPELSDTKALLGRVLFYDTKLSANNSVSCASCHQQSLAFSDDVAKSEGFNGELTKRNSQALAATANFQSSYGTADVNGNTLVNVASNDVDFKASTSAGFFWDDRALTIAEQSRQTIQDKVEMGMDLGELAAKLQKEDYYQVLFRKAFGVPVVTEDRILESLQEFVNSFVSTKTKFDEGMNQHNTPFSEFLNYTQQENLGKQLFNNNCSSCHGADMSNQAERVAHNGLEIRDNDLGVGGITNVASDEGKFKVPFLRNVAITGPYMHDGRFATLEEVIDHYSEGVNMHPNLDFRLRDPMQTDQPVRFNFSQEEKSALLAFLRTLTDQELIYDERFSDPFWK
ncbi:cytochrome-c peroxidase [Flavilitoribacter nigricans]|uniref:Cytochrome-c peroxidase n=1 Tax=Flavilitoribacter nigricans (strain ATCC 23147 / DSM 23189 / NBRC 102662 / NCIMB 1420 / SS-2) TaxID=1122177 RepID=A0A2D0N7F5_FLAN2|nr:cytochrome c peroxidase [Flavilitoribacter nigricans]PHN04452.1 cytochrome-c peroxidase [Flavilitoribacter nigricans DSM 23189 = NBRC 102662]